MVVVVATSIAKIVTASLLIRWVDPTRSWGCWSSCRFPVVASVPTSPFVEQPFRRLTTMSTPTQMQSNKRVAQREVVSKLTRQELRRPQLRIEARIHPMGQRRGSYHLRCRRRNYHHHLCRRRRICHASALTQIPLDNCISIDIDIEQCGASDDKVDSALLVEAGDVTMRADLVVIEGGQATVLESMLATLSFDTKH